MREKGALTQISVPFSCYYVAMTSHTLEETKAVAEAWLTEAAAEKAKKTAENCAVVLGLCGDLGAGKTSFTQFLAKALGVAEQVTSPTFVIQKNYRTTHPVFTKLIHIDAYRLEKADELAVLGFCDLLKDQSSLIVIEWPEKVASILPSTMHKICFRFLNDTERDIVIDPL